MSDPYIMIINLHIHLLNLIILISSQAQYQHWLGVGQTHWKQNPWKYHITCSNCKGQFSILYTTEFITHTKVHQKM